MAFDFSKLLSNKAKAGAAADATKQAATDLAQKAAKKAEAVFQNISGAAGDFLTGAGSDQAARGAVTGPFYFPAELIAGTTPRIKGQERSLAWNAAAEACDSERIHLVWTATEDRVWYVAVRAADLASHPQSWCPFASFLPGMKDAAPPPVCYTFYSDEAATMLTVTSDLIQVHRGTSSVVRAKAERVMRELGGGQIVEVTPDFINTLRPQPWISLSLFEDRLRRMMSLLAVVSALGVAMLSFVLWLLAATSLIAAKGSLVEATQRSKDKTDALMKQVQDMRASPLYKQIAKFMELNDSLVQMGGWLKMYELRPDGKVVWKAVVPGSITGDRIRDLGGKTIETTDLGVVISNDPGALTDQKK